MPGTRSDRARTRARDLLATVYPVPDDAEFHRLRELALDYIQEAERLEAERKGRVLESDACPRRKRWREAWSVGPEAIALDGVKLRLS